mgnify:CR=1 FL=1
MIQWGKFASSFAGKAKGMYSKGKSLTTTGYQKGKAMSMAGMQKAKTATMKGVSKGKALGTSLKSKQAQFYKDVDMYKGSMFKQFAADARTEGRNLRKVAKNIKPLQTAFKYPITTGAAAGVGVSAALPKKEKKKNRRNYG